MLLAAVRAFVLGWMSLLCASCGIEQGKCDEVRQAIASAVANEAGVVALAAYTPFEWDRLIAFRSYTPTEVVRERAAIEYQGRGILGFFKEPGVPEGISLFVFMNSHAPVCYFEKVNPRADRRGDWAIDSVVFEDSGLPFEKSSLIVDRGGVIPTLRILADEPPE